MRSLIVAGLCGLFATYILYHHKKAHGCWYHRRDLDCHEVLVVGLIAYAIGVLS